MKPLLLALLATLPICSAVPESLPAIAITIDTPRAAPPTILTAVWTDGSIVWSKDRENGGPPYLTAKIDPAKTTAFLAKLDQDGTLKKLDKYLVHLGPDASYHQIELMIGKKNITLISWHELFERRATLVATSHGISEIPDGKTREQVLKEDKQKYRDFRTLWKQIRDFSEKQVPKKGKPYEEPMKFEYPD
jgi:hypothetical protein